MGRCLTKALAAVALVAHGATAQAAREVSLLRMPAWPRAAGLADIGAATLLPEGLFYNPALAGSAAMLAGSAHFFGSDSSLTTLVAGLTTGVANVGAGIQLLRADVPLPNQTVVSTAGASLRFKGIRWGASAKVIQLIESGRTGSDVAFDVGVQRPFGPFSTGLAVQNLGADMDLEGEDLELPTRVTLAAEGQGLPVGAFVEFGAAAAVAVDRDGEVLPAIAGQVIYAPLDGWTFALRGGVRRPAPDSNQRPVTGGLGFTLDRLTVDYALEGVKGGDVVHRIGLRLR